MSLGTILRYILRSNLISFYITGTQEARKARKERILRQGKQERTQERTSRQTRTQGKARTQIITWQERRTQEQSQEFPSLNTQTYPIQTIIPPSMLMHAYFPAVSTTKLQQMNASSHVVPAASTSQQIVTFIYRRMLNHLLHLQRHYYLYCYYSAIDYRSINCIYSIRARTNDIIKVY